MVLTARGAEQHSTGSDTVLAWINVALALGMVGRRGAGYGCLTGQGNGQGGREHGQKADQLPGYRRIDDPAARAHVAEVWGVEPDALPGPGRSAYELLDALGTDDGPSALLVMGSNIVVSAPNATHVTSRLESLDLLVVCDVVMSETAAIADVVLPVTQWAEETGTMTNLEGRVVLRQRAITPPSGVRSDLDVIAGLAARLSDVAFETDPEAVFAELGRASAGGPADYSAITYDRIRDEGGVFWGGERLFAETFAHPDGRARMYAVEHRGAAEQPCADYPVHLTTGRVLAQYQSGAQTRRVRALPDDGPFVELHPLLAGRLGVADGRAGARLDAARHDGRARPGGADDPARHRLRAVPLGRRQPAHQRRPRPGLADAGVQGVRRLGRLPWLSASSSSAAAWPPYAWPSSWWAPTCTSPSSPTSRTRPTTGSCSPPSSRAPTRPTRSRCARRSGSPRTASTCASARGCWRSTATPARSCWSTGNESPSTGSSWPADRSPRCRRSAAWCAATAPCTRRCTPSGASPTARRLALLGG